MNQLFKEHSLDYNGHTVTVLEPCTKIRGRHFWVWRAEFLGAFDYADRELIHQGWYVAYYKVSDMYGSPQAIKLMKNFHDYIVEKFNLHPKADLFGFSRGGLYAVNYTLQYPEDVSSLYLDAPVLDIKSWPAGYGIGKGSVMEWEQCKKIYGLTDETAKNYRQSPIDRSVELIAAKVPIILVAGDSDEVVPYAENGEKLVNAYRKANAEITVIIKKEVGHHPHSLKDPKKIVDFIKLNRNI